MIILVINLFNNSLCNFYIIMFKYKPRVGSPVGFFSGWRRQRGERCVRHGAQQAFRREHDGIPAGQRRGDGQSAPPVTEERDAAGGEAAGGAADFCCQVDRCDLKEQFATVGFW